MNGYNENDNENEGKNNHGQSMLEVLESRNKTANKKTILNRAIFIGKLRNNATKFDLGDYYDKMFKNLPNNQKVSPYHEKVSGIIIIYPTIIVHLIETSLDVIKFVLRDMDEMINNPSGLIGEAKLINIARDASVRLFPFYTSKVMNLSIEFDSSEPTETVDVLVNETIVRLLRLGKFLNDNTKTQFKKETIDTIHELHPEFLPNQNTANFLVRNETILSPKDYLDYHEKPLDIVLESELTWPAPFKFFSYQ